MEGVAEITNQVPQKDSIPGLEKLKEACVCLRQRDYFLASKNGMDERNDRPSVLLPGDGGCSGTVRFGVSDRLQRFESVAKGKFTHGYL